LRICIASPDILGPIRNGGVGTACTALAQFLAAEGHEVTLFYTSDYFEEGDAETWREAYAGQGIQLMLLDSHTAPPLHRTPAVEEADYLARSYHVYQQLRGTDFDLIHFVDYIGLGYFTALARSQGLCLQNTLLAVTTHSPTLWSRLANARAVDDLSHLLRDRMERRLIALCDLAISPSRYMLRWLGENGFRLPAWQEVVPNLMPRRLSGTEPQPAEAPPMPAPVRELVFFGRLEPRKGLLVFCDAMDRIRHRLPPDLRITFLGKSIPEFPAETILARAASWGRATQVLETLDTFAANDYLRGEGRVAVLAALTDNAPYTVLECLSRGVPFIASEVGGVAEMVAPASRDAILFPPTPAALADRIQAVLDAPGGWAPARAASPAGDAAAAAQRELHGRLEALSARRRAAPPTPPRPLSVSVVILHHERPAGLAGVIAALDAQTVRASEIIVVDNGSRSDEAIRLLAKIEGAARPDLRVLRLDRNLYEPAARNAGAYAATGEYVLFMDDDNIPKPREVERFSLAAERGGADVLTCFSDYFHTELPPGKDAEAVKRFVVMGDIGPLGLLMNSYGDLNCLVRRERFLAIGGFVVDGRFNHAEDWRFFVKAWSRGLRVDVVPEALFWYRTAAPGAPTGWRKRDRSGALARAAEVYMEVAPEEARPFLLLAQGLFWRALEAERARQHHEATAQRLRAASERSAERLARLELENEVLRRKLLQVCGFAEQLGIEGALEEDTKQRGLAFIRGIGQRFAEWA
jgi:glycosyltransferase involved in cell wall biosynthesis